jgi:hypothetical protein
VTKEDVDAWLDAGLVLIPPVDESSIEGSGSGGLGLGLGRGLGREEDLRLEREASGTSATEAPEAPSPAQKCFRKGCDEVAVVRYDMGGAPYCNDHYMTRGSIF